MVVDRTARAAAAASRPVLVELVFAGDPGVSMDTLCDAWPDRSRAAVQTSIWRLRRLLGPDSIITSGEVYRLGDAVAVDVDRFENEIERGIEDFELVSTGEAEVHLRRALASWRGLPDPVHLTDSGRTRRERVIELRAVAIEHLARVWIETGASGQAIDVLRELLDEQPLREQAWSSLVSAHDASGESTVAAAVATEAIGVLSGTGVEPSTGLARVLARTRRVALAEATRAEPSIPVWLEASRRGREFVGRAEETETLAQFLERTGAGHAVAAVVSGVSGVGKTRLLAETAALASARGMNVWGGRWDSHVRTPHQGLVEVLRSLVDESPLSVVAANMLDSIASTTDAGEARPGHQPPDLHQILTIVGDVVAGVTIDRPTLLVLDDVQWASHVSLLMLRHLVQSNPTVPLALLVGLSTSVPVDRSTRQILDGVVRPNGSRWLELGGLSPIEVAALPEVAHGARSVGEDSRSLGRSIVTYTGGNPLLIDRVLDEPGIIERVLRSDQGIPDSSSLPARLAAAAGTFLTELDDAARVILGTAALIGTDFDLALLQRAIPEPVDAAIAQGTAARLVELHGHRASFLHNLLAEALIDTLDVETRQLAHARIAEALGGIDPGASPIDVFALAHHLDLAGSLVPAPRVVEVAHRAAVVAGAQFDFGIAAHFFEIAANHAPFPAAVDQLLAAVEESTLDGDATEASRLLKRAERQARPAAGAVELAKVAVAACELSLRVDGYVSDEASGLVREVRVRFDPRADEELYSELSFFDSLGRESARALFAVARAEPDPNRGVAIAERGLELGPLSARPGLVDHLRASTSVDGRVLGTLWDWVVGVQDGVATLDAPDRAAELDGLATRQGVDDAVRWRVVSWHATRAIACGEFRLGGALAERAAAMGQALADRRWRMKAVMARWTHQGCLEFLTGSTTGTVHGVGRYWGTGALFSRPWDAHRLAWAGRFSEARTLLGESLAQARRRLVPDGARLVHLMLLASAAHAMNDESTARGLREDLDPHRSQAAVHVESFIGLIEHNAALLAGTTGDLEAAIGGFRSAAEQAASRGAEPYAVLSRMQHLLHLERRGEPGDGRKHARLRPAVLADAERLGMPRVGQVLSL